MKTRLHTLFFTLALIVGTPPAQSQPALSISPAGSQALVSWPAAATNYVLQSTTNLVAPSWVAVSGAVPGSNLSVAYDSPARYFRLYQNVVVPGGMALIPAGGFTMGDNLDGETDAFPTNVYVSAFHMDVNLVSSNQWQSVYVYAMSHGYNFVNAGTAKAADQPVQTVNWFDCVKWCNARSQQAGLTPCYYTDAGFARVFTNGDYGTPVYLNLADNGYRLPTEAEWEKAARGGLSGNRFPWGNTISETQANYQSIGTFSYDLGPAGYNSIGNFPATNPGTSPVGSFGPNGYGLNDMAGNVAEWCWDWYATPYAQPTTNNPTGPAGPLNFRVMRGGNWYGNALNARCANRSSTDPSIANHFTGFRCVKGL